MIYDQQKLSKALAEPCFVNDRHISSQYFSKAWPLVQPEFVFVLEAVQIVGKAKFGDEWTGRELDAVKWYHDPITTYRTFWENALTSARGEKKPPNIITSLSSNIRSAGPKETDADFDVRKLGAIAGCERVLASVPDHVEAKQQRWKSNQEATVRLFSAIRWLGDKCRGGLIEGAFQYKRWPKMYKMDAHLWNGPSDIERWAKNGGYPEWLNKVKYDTELFVRRDQLQREIAALEHSPLLIESSDLSRLSPDLQLAVRLALENQIFDENNGGLKSGQVTEKVISAAAVSGRTIALGRIEEIARLIRYPDAKRSSAGQKSARNKK